jgi:DNA polymerase-1
MNVVCDVETDALHNPTRIWCIVCIDAETGEEYVFEHPQENKREFLEFASRVHTWIGHNFIDFDRVVIRDLLAYSIPVDNILDTLVLSRLFNFRIDRGHSIEAWGERLGSPKTGLDVRFDVYSEELLERCKQDTRICRGIYLKCLPFIQMQEWQAAIKLEMRHAQVCRELHDTGIPFDEERAKELLIEIEKHLERLDEIIQKEFPPRSRLLREITPRATKFETINRTDFRWHTSGDLSSYSIGDTFSLIEFEEFNPASHKQLVERLNEAGWKPFEKTDGHIEAIKTRDNKSLEHQKVYGWKVNEANLATLPADAPQATQKLTERFLVSKRYSTLKEYLSASTVKCGPFGTIPMINGQFNSIGTWTHRMSHSNPNLGNPPSTHSKYNGERLKKIHKYYGEEIRKLFYAPEGFAQIGTDADAIQLRVLAEVMNDEEMMVALDTGDKKLGTDAHTLNKHKIGDTCKDREDAKTFIYAWLLGAGADKVASIFGCSKAEAKEAVKIFLDNTPKLEYLKNVLLKKDAQKGYFIGFDQRKVKVTEERLVLAGYLQNGESTIMKLASHIWIDALRKDKIPFWFINMVHDEFQTLTYNDKDLIEKIQLEQTNAIHMAGLRLNLKCPFRGQSKVGFHWLDTH